MKHKLPLAILAVLSTSAAHADLLYSTSFESPTYTAGTSIAGVDGWYVGSSSDSAATQTVTAGLANSGAQGLRIASAATTSYYSVGHALPAEGQGTSPLINPFSVSVDIFMDPATAATRTYELNLSSTNSGNLAGNTVLVGMNIGGDGKIRASRDWANTLGSANGQRTIVPAGTYAGRWLTLTLSIAADRYATATFSGFGGSTPSYSYAITTGPVGYNATTGLYSSIVGANLVADNTGAFGGAGVGTFDNFRVSNPVPEPASMAALGLGLVALARRRRKA